MTRMRRKDKELRELSQMEAVIREAKVLRIAMFDEEFPYLVPVSFGFKAGTFYFHCAPEGKKVQLLERNGNVCFEVEAGVEPLKGSTPCKWSMQYASVIGFGRAFPVEDPREKRKALEIILSHYDPAPDELKEDLSRLSVFGIQVVSMTGKLSGHPEIEGLNPA